jgi:hypothetical protein
MLLVSNLRNYSQRSTDSQGAWQLARSWINQCRTHDLCRTNGMNGSFIPTRLIQITNVLSGRGPDGQPTIKLVESVELDQNRVTEYVALSHCWGKEKTTEFTKLLVSNLDEFKKSIPFDHLPPNFKHAIIATEGLGYAYLWIDSLCIIQKCEEDLEATWRTDWEAEASNMGLVYTNAACTISASRSANPFHGCFSARNPFNQDCILRTEGHRALVVRSDLGEDAALDWLFENLVNSEPLNSRGWAFQERMLSRRVLHFCEGIILFECNTMRGSEYHEKGIEYSKRANIRADGSLHTPAMVHRLMQEDVPHQTIYTTREVIPEIQHGNWESMRFTEFDGVPEEQRVVEIVANPDYETKRQKKRKILEISASSGIRGSFQHMIQCSRGESLNWAEIVEWHQSWYDLVGEYSVCTVLH